MSRLQDLWEKQKRQIATAAASHLEAGENVRYVVLAQTKLPNWLAPVPFAAFFGVQKRVLVVTDRSVCVFAMPMLSPTKVSGIVERHAITAGALRREGGAVYVGSSKLWPVGNALMRGELDGAITAVKG